MDSFNFADLELTTACTITCITAEEYRKIREKELAEQLEKDLSKGAQTNGTVK